MNREIDVISRKSLIAWLNNFGVDDFIIDKINDKNRFPNEYRRGYWIKQCLTGDWPESTSWKCSQCGDLHDTMWKPDVNFCKNCGADMRESDGGESNENLD